MVDKPTTLEECKELGEVLGVHRQLIAEACGITTQLDEELAKADTQSKLRKLYKNTPPGSTLGRIILQTYLLNSETQNERKWVCENASVESTLAQLAFMIFLTHATTQNERRWALENLSAVNVLKNETLGAFLANATTQDERWYVYNEAPNGSRIREEALLQIIENH